MRVSNDSNHAIQIDKEKCIGCSHCMRGCPTEAIRVWNGKAIIDDEKCVDCGDCFRVCPVKAIYVSLDSIPDFSNINRNVALIPSVFYGQFPARYSKKDIDSAIIELGFYRVVEVEESVDLLKKKIIDYVSRHPAENVISSYCPAVVRLIQTRFPELIAHLIPMKTPLEITALKLRRELRYVENLQLYYITPCASKTSSISHSNITSEVLINAVIGIDAFYNLVLHLLNVHHGIASALDVEKGISKTAVLWGLSGGEIASLQGRCLSIDGMNHIMEFLEKLDIDENHQFDFLEMKACDQGCAGGILNSENRFFCVGSMKNRAHASLTKDDNNTTNHILNAEDTQINEIQNCSVLALDKDQVKALKIMNKTRRLMCYLPGFDCGACGAPTCKSLAEDVAKGNAILSHCVFMQRQMEKHHRLSPQHAFNIIESIWGKDRLDKDCNKKGAINDYS